MIGICLLKNSVQEYAWGSYTAIPELMGKDSPASVPQAELWMGAHPKAPSMATCSGTQQSLVELIQKHPKLILGEKVAEKFQNKLPYLFKVLAAEKPLSIQAHPSLDQAKIGFKRENKLGIPFDGFMRNYKDDNHKPECICALSVFWALNGFRNISDMISLLERVCPPGLEKALGLLCKNSDSVGLKHFFQTLMTMDPNFQKQVIKDAINKAQPIKEEERAFQWMIDLNREYPMDIGVFSPIILNLICLEPGQAMFLPVGTLHAYLKGVGIELMANSDNVLRGGLTPKHVDVKELLNVLDFIEGEVNILNSKKINLCERRYETPAEEFVLSVITVRNGVDYYIPDNKSVEILLCTKGDAVVADVAGNKSIHIEKGMSILIPAAVEKYRIKGNAVFYKAAVPMNT